LEAVVATEWAELIPTDVAREVIDAAAGESAVLALGNSVVMPSGVVSVPVVSVAPQAVFVGVRKPASTIEWTAERLEPAEIALTLYIPDAYLDDAGFPVWESARAEIAKAIARTLDAAVLWGTNAPASYPSGGIAALTGPATSGTDALDAIDKAAEVVEATGLVPDGIAAGTKIGSALRKAYREIATPPSTVPDETIYGMNVARSPAWDDAQGDALVGDWSKLLVGIREDISFDLSDSATLTDGAGNVVVSAFESDVTAMRAYARIAVANCAAGAAGRQRRDRAVRARGLDRGRGRRRGDLEGIAQAVGDSTRRAGLAHRRTAGPRDSRNPRPGCGARPASSCPPFSLRGVSRDELGEGMHPATLHEMAELARARAAALGRPVAVVAFTGSDRCTVVDLDVDDEADELGQLRHDRTTSGVLLENPSPSLAEPD
jgi:hypothetical protein